MKAVIIKFGALGDIILSTPVIRKLCNEHKNDKLFLLTSPAFATLFDEWPDLEIKQVSRKGAAAMLKAIFWLRSQHFDRVYDLQSNDRSRLLCCLSGIREKVGNHNRFPYSHHPGDCYTGQNHIFARHNQLLNSVGIEHADASPWLPVSRSAEQKVNQWLDNHKLSNEKIVLMHAGASSLHPKKRWPHFLSLAVKLSAAGYKVIWLGASDDAELNKSLTEKVGTDASKAFSITELIALGQKAVFAVTNDSGPMHVLSCAGIPVYGLFGPTNWRRNHAIGQAHRVVSLDKSNALWSEHDYTKAEKSELSLISAEMLLALLLQENQIVV